MKKSLKFLAVLPGLLAGAHAMHAGPVVIDEIMYHPNSTNLLREWFELYNPGPNSVSLAGWQMTRGVQFTFPANTTLAAGGYLVVAADSATFSAEHPGVPNFVAGWAAPISGHTLELSDAQGKAQESVTFYSDGDWAVRRMGLVQYNHQGWEWYAAHDGEGHSLELINAALPNSYALNWGSSAAVGGTPGQPNSIAATNAAPLITAVTHAPVIPRPTDTVTISARIVDEHTTGLTVTLSYRIDGAASFTTVPMLDDGAHGDGLAADGIYGATLPAQANGTVVEFFLQAGDLEGHVRTYPNFLPPGNSARTANLLYQVDSGSYSGADPVYRIIMTEVERADLYALGRKCPDSDSDAAMNATFITTDGVLAGGTTTQLRYNVDVRNRGHGTRQSNPNNYHLNIPGDRAWKHQSGINFNSQYAHSQVLGSAVFRRLGVPMAESRGVQLRVNSTNLMVTVGGNSYGAYAANEQYNGDFLKRAYPGDSQGNSYRGIRDSVLCVPALNGVADLAWHGANPTNSAYALAYFKQNNYLEDDWSDLIDLIAVLNSTNGHVSANYVADVQQRIDVQEWMRYMAINTLLANGETCLANGIGDDYGLYRGRVDTRFQALPYDLDSVMGQGPSGGVTGHVNDGLFVMNALPAISRFMQTPEFAPAYYRQLKELADTAFAPEQMNPLLDQLLGGWVPAGTLATMKSFNAARVAFVLGQIPLSLTVSNNLTLQGGFPHSTSPTVALFGSANAIDTRSVLVNGAPATYTAWLGTWTNSSVALQPGLNRVLVQALNSSAVEIARTNYDVWYDDGSVQTVSGTIAADTTWTAAGGPYNVTANLTIASGATLTIEPGTTVYLGSAVNFAVASGGRLLAEGTLDAPIRFTVTPGSGVSWGGLTIAGGVGSPETRIAYAYFEHNGNTCIEVQGGTLHLDHTTFGTTTHQYVSLDGSSFLLSNCYFPTATAPSGFELLHGTGGIKAGGRGIVRECFFGSTTGYNDIMDFTGGNRDENQPIIQYYNNVFVGGSDDMLDLDGTDAWIEGNIFLHCHQNGSPDSSSAISGGNYSFGGAEGTRTSEITAIGNIFFDVDNVATAKEGNFFSLLNNTIVHVTKVGGGDSSSGVVNVRDFPSGGAPTAFGRGFYLEGNIIQDVEQLVRNYDAAQVSVTLNGNILPSAWAGPGSGNTLVNPGLKHIPTVAEAVFTTWEQAQVLRDWFSLRPGSPALGAGPNGTDQGGVIPLGVSLSGEPTGTTPLTTATLTVGINRTGSGIPVAGFPNGSGFSHYQWRLDGGAWSAETPIATPITLTGLANGPHHVDAIGKNDAGWYQNDPAFGPEAVITSSRTWTVDPTHSRIVLNELLAKNRFAVNHEDTAPDVLELYHDGAGTFDLSGLALSDDPLVPRKFVFPAGTTLGPNAYLVVYADSDNSTSGLHLGFGLKETGGALYLYDRPAGGGALLDSVAYGWQLADRSIGRLAGGTWALCQPTFGAANVPVLVGDPTHLKINEWLADAQYVAKGAFVELYNPDAQPVGLGGLFLSNAEGAPGLSPVPALSFIDAHDFASFQADASPGKGADHLAFKLSPDIGMIRLSAADGSAIDLVNYGPQRTDVAQGRSPNGGAAIVALPQPTPGGGNPGAGGGSTDVTTITMNLLTYTNAWKYYQAGDPGSTWHDTNFSDAAWSSGPGLIYFTSRPANITGPKNTVLTDKTRTAYYFRTHFNFNTNTAGFRLNLSHYIDDGAVFYLNGKELNYRLNMPAGAVTYGTFATLNVSDAVEEGPFEVSAAELVQGDNQLAVEVHQQNAASSDVVFGLKLDAFVAVTNSTPGGDASVVLNEVLAHNVSLTNANGAITDWIELYNPGTNAIDLADLSLTDDAANARKWVFPSGTTLASQAHLLITSDDAAPASANNTGFKLSGTGGTVYLYDKPANGSSLLDSIAYGVQAADYSIGRVPDGSGAWTLNLPTPGAANNALVAGDATRIKVNEWMANPSAGDDWFELYNPNSLPVALGGLYLTDDLTKPTFFPIQALSFLGTGANAFRKFHADGSTTKGADHVNFKLSAKGEAIGLFTAGAALIDAVNFVNQLVDVSEGRLPDGTGTIVQFPTTATPGAGNYLPLAGVVVNEVLPHTDPPLEDAVEFYNPTAADVAIGGWFLSNTTDDLKKFQVAAGTVVPAHGYLVLYEFQFNGGTGSAVPFTFNSAHGDAAWLSAADAGGNLTGYRATANFGAAANGVSFGRFSTSVGVDFVAQSTRSFGQDTPATLAQFRLGTGQVNPGPLLGELAINEIMFHPPNVGGTNGPDNTIEEYVELHNVSGGALALFDPAAATNSWKVGGGISFTFPTNQTLAAGAYALLVSFDPALDPAQGDAFRAKYSVAADVQLFGPYSGTLNNSGNSIELLRPDPPQLPPHPDAGFVPYVVVERVKYSSTAPWPTDADGTGLSLQRISGYVNDPVNWKVAAPTAGSANDNTGTPKPVIDTPPQSQIVNVGAPVTFTVAATGTGLSYQWRFNSNNLANAFGASYSILSAQLTNAGSYDVVVSNAGGSVTSAEATLTVNDPNLDSDGDGLPDAWEIAHQLDPHSALGDHGASGDPDHDGFTNLQEYQAGTDPQSASSYLKVEAVVPDGGTGYGITFTAVAGITYTVQYRDSLDTGGWLKLSNVSAQATTGPVSVPDTNPATSQRFYRILTPALP